MERRGVAAAAAAVAAVLAAGCASAGDPGNGTADAPENRDRDASLHADAPLGHPDSTQPLDGAVPIDAPAQLCASGATCPAATALAGISGDTNADQVTATGYQSAWYSVRVTEDDSGVFAVPMSFTAVLTSPASAHYQLFVYIDTDTDALDCATPTGAATVSGTTESEYMTWGESGTFSNGADDTRTLSIEVRAPATGCEPGSTWSLVVDGDT